MPETQESVKLRRFRTSMSEALGRSNPRMLNQSFVESETSEALAALERLASYDRFLDQARTQRSQIGTISSAFENEALYQARRARQDCNIAVEKILNVVKHYRLSGFLDEALSGFGRALEESGPLTLGQLIDAARDDEETTSVLRNTAITPANLKRIWDTVSEQRHEISVASGRLTVTAPSGRIVAVRLPGENQQRSIMDILYGQGFDASVTSLSRSGRSLIDFIVPVGEGVSEDARRIEDLLLELAVRARSEMARHVRQIEQVGFAIHQGKGPGAALLLLIGAILLGLILMVGCCGDAGPQGDCCHWGVVIFLLSILAFGGLTDPQSQGSPTTTTYSNPSPA